MNKKLLFFDIDGTLLNEKTHTISASTRRAIQQAKNNGHLIFINTGRTRATIDQCIEALEPDGYVCGCGTFISYRDKLLYHVQVDQNICDKLISTITHHQLSAILEASDRIYFPKDIKDEVVAYIYQLYSNAHFPLGFIEDDDVHLDKFCIQFYHDVSTFAQEIENDFEIIKRSPVFWEIVPKNHSKATGIQYLVDYFGLSLDDCYVFGDSFNDEPMLSYVKHAIVMKNGDKELYKLAEYVTDDIDHDGIEKALHHYGLI